MAAQQASHILPTLDSPEMLGLRAIRTILTHLGGPLDPRVVALAHGPAADRGEFVQVHDDQAIFQASPDEMPRHRHPQPLTAFHATVPTAREKNGFKTGLRQREKSGLERGEKLFGTSKRASHPARPAPAVAPHDPSRSADACRSAFGRPILWTTLLKDPRRGDFRLEPRSPAIVGAGFVS